MLFQGIKFVPKFLVPFGIMLLLDFQLPEPSYRKLAYPVPVPIIKPASVASNPEVAVDAKEIVLSAISKFVELTTKLSPSTYKLPCKYVLPPMYKSLPTPTPPVTTTAPVKVEFVFELLVTTNVVTEPVVKVRLLIFALGVVKFVAVNVVINDDSTVSCPVTFSVVAVKLVMLPLVAAKFVVVVMPTTFTLPPTNTSLATPTPPCDCRAPVLVDIAFATLNDLITFVAVSVP